MVLRQLAILLCSPKTHRKGKEMMTQISLLSRFVITIAWYRHEGSAIEAIHFSLKNAPVVFPNELKIKSKTKNIFLLHITEVHSFL